MALDAQDTELEQAINEYLDAAIALERESYRSEIEPFENYSKTLRIKLTEGFKNFRKSYAKGFTILMNEIHKTHPEKVLTTNDTPKDTDALYALLGFRKETVDDCYEAACKIVEEDRFADGQAAFFFLVTLAPTVSAYWLDLGFCHAKLGEYEQAIEAYCHAIELDPESADGYLSCASAYIKMQDFEQAQNTCDVGLKYAQNHLNEPWAKELQELLEEAKIQIEDLYNKSKYGTFSS